MSVTTKVDSRELMSMASEFESYASNYNNHFQRLRDHGYSLDATWEGEANDKFRVQVEADINACMELYRTILTYNEALQVAAREYSEAEMRNIDRIQNAMS